MPNYFRKSIKRQFLYILFFVLLATMIGIAAFFYMHYSTNKQYEKERNVLVEKRGVLQNIKSDFSDMVFHMRGYALYTNEQERQNAESSHTSLENNLTQLEAFDLSLQERDNLTRLQTFEDIYWNTYYPELREAIESDNLQGIAEEVADERIDEINDILRVTENLRQHNEDAVTELHNEFMQDNTQESYMLFLFVLLIFGILLFFNRQFTRNIGKPLYDLSIASYDVAQGKNVTIAPLDRNDEIGILSDAFRDMTKRIRNREQNLSEKNTKLTEQQEQLESFVNDLRNLNWALNESSMVLVLDEKGVVKQVNENFSSTSLYPEKELIGRNFVGIIAHEENTTEVRNIFLSCLKGRHGAARWNTVKKMVQATGFMQQLCRIQMKSRLWSSLS